jgi:hypothetical protein
VELLRMCIFVKSPSFVFEQLANEQVKWQRPVGYSYLSHAKISQGFVKNSLKITSET